MRLVSFISGQSATETPTYRAGALQAGGTVVDLSATDGRIPNSVREILAAGAAGHQLVLAAMRRADAVVAADARLGPPIPNPQKIFGVGLNYRDHAAEQGVKPPAEPVIFAKLPSAVAPPDGTILLPRESTEVDFEAELVVVIGTAGRRIPVAQALDWVAGYTCGNDVSARDWQQKKDGKQWVLGKSFDSFAPTGPALVTRDEIPDPHALGIRFRLNGQTMQQSNTSAMIFSVAQLVAYVSQVCMLAPGDLIFTGTPSGVGFPRKPPVFLRPGDLCEVEIDQLGVLRGRCVAD